MPDLKSVMDQLWVDEADLVQDQSPGAAPPMILAMGQPFTGMAATFGPDGEWMALMEHREGKAQGLRISRLRTDGLWEVQECLLGLPQGHGWLWNSATQQVEHWQLCHGGAVLLTRELDLFGQPIGELVVKPKAGLAPDTHQHWAALDVSYADDGTALAACVVFTGPGHMLGEQELLTCTVKVEDVAPYEPGEFYKRELPCLLAVLREVGLPLDVVVVDGYVFLEAGKPGLGAHLHHALGGNAAVVGVAKTSFKGGQHMEVQRGGSAQPLFVGALGMEEQKAAEAIKGMKGSHRLPDALRHVDALSKGFGFQPS